MDDDHTFLKSKKGIILAADVVSIDDLRRLVDLSEGVPEVVAIKIGFSLALRYGLPVVVNAIRKTCGIPIIYDHQKAGTDIPAMGQPFAETCRDTGVNGVIFFPLAGPKTLESFVSAAFDCSLTPIVGLVMTHSSYLKSEGGFIDDNSPRLICQIALDIGVRNFVLPGNKPDIVRKFSEGPLAAVQHVNIMMPGIGIQGGTITHAFEATNGHHPFAIIGSALYKASDPSAAIEQYAAEIR